MGNLSNKIILGLLTLTLLSTGGAFGAWVYSGMAPNPTNQDVGINIEDWYYNFTPEEGDPDYNPEENHDTLLQQIISDTKGINGSGSSLLNAVINSRFSEGYEDVTSNAHVTGGNLKNQFDFNTSFGKLDFLINFADPNRYEIYTYSSSVHNMDVGDLIEVYKTYAVLKDGKYVLSGGYKGYAPVAKYDGKTQGNKNMTINELKWKEGEIPTT